MRTPLISILVPTHNRCDLLKETLDSIFNQNSGLEEIELIISNDGSKDGTEAYLDQLKTNSKFPIYVFNHDKNIGGPGNWRFLLEQAKGEFVYLLSDDDHIKSNFLKNYIAVITKYPDIDIVYSGIHYCDENMRPRSESLISSVSGLVDSVERLKNQLKSNHMVMSSIYRREVFLRAGGWQDKYGACIDVGGFTMMCTQSRQTYFINEALFCFRLGLQTWSSFRPEIQKKIYKSSRLIIDDVSAWAKRDNPDSVNFFKSCYSLHAQGILNMLDLKIVHGEISRKELKTLLSEVYDVYPEVLKLSSFYKLHVVCFFGVRWLEVLRTWLGRGIHGTSVFEKDFVPQGELK